MKEKRPPYLIRTVTRHGKVAWYFWKRPHPKTRIHGEYGSPEFLTAYQSALAKIGPAKTAGTATSLSIAIRDYRASPQWATLSAATRKQRGNILDRIEAKSGATDLADIDDGAIRRGRDAMSGPGAAKHFVQTMRGLFKWAVEAKRVGIDPTEGVKVARPKTDGFVLWTEADIAAYEARWPIGTRQRLWLAVMLYTGLRRGDACRLGPDHVEGDVIAIQTGKTGILVTIPLAAQLAEIIAASPTGARTFIATIHGTPMTKEFFGNLFREACDKAGVAGAAHGLRKAAATRLAEAGATVPELNAVFGWTGARMALLYVEKADRARLAKQAMERLKKRNKELR